MSALWPVLAPVLDLELFLASELMIKLATHAPPCFSFYLHALKSKDRTEHLWGHNHRYNRSIPSTARVEGNMSLLDISEVCM
jgi:hypothetical protein